MGESEFTNPDIVTPYHEDCRMCKQRDYFREHNEFQKNGTHNQYYDIEWKKMNEEVQDLILNVWSKMDKQTFHNKMWNEEDAQYAFRFDRSEQTAREWDDTSCCTYLKRTLKAWREAKAVEKAKAAKKKRIGERIRK